MSKLLFTGTDWTLDLINETWEVIDKIAKEKYGLDYFKPDIRLITAEQMLTYYTTVGMPIMYEHWSYGKDFITQSENYKNGHQGLAYEIVINTDPAIAYLMETNTMTMQTLVMAHACCGHASFFKNNYMFKEFTDPAFILDYLSYAKKYVAEMEEKLGQERVTQILDVCHMLQNYGIDKYKKTKNHELPEISMTWEEYEQSKRDLVMDTTLNGKKNKKESGKDTRFKVELPCDNLLYFIEKMAPVLTDEERELVRIVRTIAQYFYPQMQTQVMNEGWATFWHYTLMGDLYDEGYIDEGSYLEFLTSHTAVVAQPDFDSDYFSGINPYALGFAMFQDIKRMCENPTDEDRKYFPDIVDTDWNKTLHHIMKNYRDESFILQYLSPKVARDFKLFCIHDDSRHPRLEVAAIHNDQDFKELRFKLSEQYRLSKRMPSISIVDYEYEGNRSLHILNEPEDGVQIEVKSAHKIYEALRELWGFPVYIHVGSYDSKVK